MEQRLFVRCNACGVHAQPFDYAMPSREAGQRVSHWPCSEQEHGHWVAVLLLAHDWTCDAWSGATCKRCGAWASTMKPIPRYGCVPPGETSLTRYVSDANCLTAGDGACISLIPCMHTPRDGGNHCDACGYPLDECVCRDEP